MKKLKTKNEDAQKKRSGREVRGVNPEAGRESMVGKICERGFQRYDYSISKERFVVCKEDSGGATEQGLQEMRSERWEGVDERDKEIVVVRTS